MTYFKKLAALILVGSTILPSAGFAQRAKQVAPPVTYAQFTLSPADMAEFQTPEYQACQARAARASDRATREVLCESDRKDLLEPRLMALVNTTQSGLQGSRLIRFLDDQLLWSRTRNDACKAKFIGLGEYSVAFIRASGPCQAEETFRRIKWLERKR